MTIITEPKPLEAHQVSAAKLGVAPREVIAKLEQHILVDGFKLIFDAEKSRGAHFVDAATGRTWIDL